MVKRSKGKSAFDIFNYFALLLFCATIILPFMHIISVSLSSSDEILKKNVGIFPRGFLLGAYKTVIQDPIFFRSLINTLFITVVTTFLSMLVNTMAAYTFSKDFFGKKVISYLFVITMFFQED
jgi:ABC-type sugar transport system, permease component